MKCLTLPETETPEVAMVSQLRLPTGLFGFEHLKDYSLVTNPGEEPFMWLEANDDGPLAFVVVNPFLIAPDYQPDIPQADIDFLGIEEADDVLLFNIVTLHKGNRATVNLKGPIVINRHTSVGKQVVLANASEYSVQHPLPLAQAVA